jgi:Sigma-70 region 2
MRARLSPSCSRCLTILLAKQMPNDRHPMKVRRDESFLAKKICDSLRRKSSGVQISKLSAFHKNISITGFRGMDRGKTHSNLSVVRWRHRLPTREEEADLVRRYRTGDPTAKDQIAKSHHRRVLKIAGHYSGPEHEDLIAAGMLGLWEAVNRYDPCRKARLGTFSSKFISGAISDCVKDWRKRGEAGETREERKAPHTNWHQRYNTIEALQADDEDGNPIGGWSSIAPDDGTAI